MRRAFLIGGVRYGCAPSDPAKLREISALLVPH